MAIEIKHPGKLHRDLHIAADKGIPDSKLKMPEGHSQNALALKKEIVFAKNARKWNHKKA